MLVLTSCWYYLVLLSAFDILSLRSKQVLIEEFNALYTFKTSFKLVLIEASEISNTLSKTRQRQDEASTSPSTNESSLVYREILLQGVSNLKLKKNIFFLESHILHCSSEMTGIPLLYGTADSSPLIWNGTGYTIRLKWHSSAPSRRYTHLLWLYKSTSG